MSYDRIELCPRCQALEKENKLLMGLYDAVSRLASMGADRGDDKQTTAFIYGQLKALDKQYTALLRRKK